MSDSPLAKKAIYEIGGNYQAIAVYDKAADLFERYAKKTAYKGEFADQALSDAVVLRLGLGQEDQAIEDANNFNKNFGATKPAQTAQIAFAIAAHYGEKKDWDNVEKRLGGSMKMIDSKATLDIVAQAHALLARADIKLGKETPGRSRVQGRRRPVVGSERRGRQDPGHPGRGRRLEAASPRSRPGSRR